MRARWVVVVGVVLVAFVGIGLFLTLRDNARPVTLDEAKGRTTSSTSAESSTSSASSEAPGDGSTTSSTPEDTPVIRRPEPGVYRYEGSGTESLSVPPLSQDQGPTMPGTVEHGDNGCWTFRIDYSTNHWQTWVHCPEGPDFVEAGGQSWQRWMIGATAITNLSDFTCDAGAMLTPADPTPGQEWTARCVGTNEAVEGEAVSEGTYRFVGTEDIAVGDTTVAAHHFVRDRTMSGSQVGTERSEVWYAVDTGLPVRNQRSLEARTDTPIGASTYTETGEFNLASVTPE